MINNQKKILTTKNLSVGYKLKGNKVNSLLNNLTLEIKTSEMICVIGPNGCGKSTLLRTLSGLQAPLQGEVTINAKAINTFNRLELAKNLSIVLTESNFNNLSILSIVGMGRYPYNGWMGKYDDNDIEIINSVISKTGLSDYKYKNIAEVSDGTKQKAMIARALAQDTPFIVLDEPTAFLDLPSKLEIMHLLKNLAHNNNKAIILSSHDLDLALQTADRILLFTSEGDMFIDTPEEMVLNGHFENVFNKKDIKFLKEKGIFKISSNKGLPVNVKGKLVEKFWTERALERLGFNIVSSNSQITIELLEDENIIKWNYRSKNVNETFYSIKDLTDFLKKILEE